MEKSFITSGPVHFQVKQQFLGASGPGTLMSVSSDADTTMRKEQGYREILKTVIKSQIQLLIEQLSDQAGEESVILTANPNEGTTSYFASSNSKGFYNNHEEIKAQFLAYCDRNHKKKVSCSTNKNTQYDDTEPDDTESRGQDVHSTKKQKVYTEGKVKQDQGYVNVNMATDCRDQETSVGMAFEYNSSGCFGSDKSIGCFGSEQASPIGKLNGADMYANNLEVEVVEFLMKNPSEGSALDPQVINDFDASNRLQDILNPSIQSPVVGQYQIRGNMPELSQLTVSLPSASQYPSSTQSFTCFQNLELQSNEVMQEMRQQAPILSPNIQSLSPEIAADAYSDIYGTTIQGISLPSLDGADAVDHSNNLKRDVGPDMVDNVICATSETIVDTRKGFKQNVIKPPIAKGVFTVDGDMMVNSIFADNNAVDKPTGLKESDNNSVDKPRTFKQMDSNIVDKLVGLNRSDNSIVDTSAELKQNVIEPPKVKMQMRRSRSSRDTAIQEAGKVTKVFKTSSRKVSEIQASNKDSAELFSNKRSRTSVSFKASSLSKDCENSLSKKVSKESVFEELYKQTVPKLAFEFPDSGKGSSGYSVLSNISTYNKLCPDNILISSSDGKLSNNVKCSHDYVGKDINECHVENDNHLKSPRCNKVKKSRVCKSKSNNMYVITKEDEASGAGVRGKRDFLTEAKATGSIFPCEQCGKIFSYRSQYEIHCITHTGEKPHPCEHCSKRFRLKHHLKRHMQNKHSI